MTVEITQGDPAEADVVALIRESDAFYTRLYPAERNYLLDVAALKQPEVSFFVARRDGLLCGFGSVVRKTGYGEIKRMYVRPEARGVGIGRRLLARLETRAAELGLLVIRLETGTRQPEAWSLYKTCGYSETGPFGDYPADPLSIFMEKHLQTAQAL
jgi:putative acetyltransferase